jgi:aminomuconate-semialdehyde/2-hydroxymuconate-6-semialdehyde dehydrogenase
MVTSPPKRIQPRHYVNGVFVAEGDTFPLFDPVNGEKTAEVPEADEKLVDEAVGAARAALTGPWGELDVDGRVTLMRRVADRIEARFDEFVHAEIADTGKPWSLASTMDIPRSIANFRMYADLATAQTEQAYRTATPDGFGALNYTVHKPLGVVAVVSPWNLPLLLLTWKVAPALVSGNTVVVKPSETTPSSATLLAEVMHEVGVPAGVFNLVHGYGGNSAGQYLTSHPGIDAIAFTGASATGSAIMKAAADHVTPLSFELGGKNAAIVFADADFDAAVAGTVKSSFTNSGQVCLCTERVYVQREIYDEFVAALAKAADALMFGRPLEENVDLGPLSSADHREKVLRYFRLASDAGAVVTGGGVPEFGDERDTGYWVEPTVLVGLSEQHPVVREEIFGPICHVAPFDTEDEAVSLANDSPYGLAATIWTTSISRAHRVAPRMDVGIAWVNCWNLRDLRTPFGGVKASGIGREGGAYSLDFFSEPMNVCVKG